MKLKKRKFREDESPTGRLKRSGPAIQNLKLKLLDEERAAMKLFLADVPSLSPAFAMCDWNRNQLNHLKNGIGRALMK